MIYDSLIVGALIILFLAPWTIIKHWRLVFYWTKTERLKRYYDSLGMCYWCNSPAHKEGLCPEHRK